MPNASGRFIHEFYCLEIVTWKVFAEYRGQKLEGLDSASLAIKPRYANFLRKDMVTFEGFLNILTIPKNFDHLICTPTRHTGGKVPACSENFLPICKNEIIHHQTH